jgi:hypothetical protein
LANWPATDQVGLMDHLKKTRLAAWAGRQWQYFLRFEGWDAFILSGDVVKALIREGVVAKEPTSKKAIWRPCRRRSTQWREGEQASRARDQPHPCAQRRTIEGAGVNADMS